MKKYAFGVDIGGTTCKIGLFKTDGTLLEKWEILTKTENGGKEILVDVGKSVQAKLQESGIEISEVQGIGLGVPGPVGKDGTVYRCVNLGWGVFNVEEALSKEIGLPVKAANDANAAALGEMWKGGGAGHPNVVLVTLGTGVGGGIILDGKILPGAHGAGGELGHMKVDPEETEICNCGGTGCLEQFASATGIVRMAKKKLSSGNRETVLSLDNLTAKAIFDAAKEGDATAVELVEDLCTILGTALANVAAVVDPEIIVIGGGVSKAGEMLRKGVEKHFRRKAFHACCSTEIALATLGNDAGIYGCVRLLF